MSEISENEIAIRMMLENRILDAKRLYHGAVSQTAKEMYGYHVTELVAFKESLPKRADG